MLSSIIFEHCSAFELPASIREFPNLLGLELWNVTLVRWGLEAALNADLHQKMVFLVMVKVNTTTLPEGVLNAPLPDLLVDIEIISSNLTRIPDEVADAWTNAQIVYVEHTPLQEFPSSLFSLPVGEISLVNDGLNELPHDLFTSAMYQNEYVTLALSYNLIRTLPDAAKQNLFVDELLMAHTEVTTLPSWVEASVGQASCDARTFAVLC